MASRQPRSRQGERRPPSGNEPGGKKRERQEKLREKQREIHRKAPHRQSRTLEHLTPIARGGTHDIDNLDFAHWSCNASKGTKTLEEYREWLKQAE
nr:MAG TPA: HNH endonuclease [Caudoviricetes sp.]